MAETNNKKYVIAVSHDELVALLIGMRVAQADFTLLYGRVPRDEEKRMGMVLKHLEFVDQRVSVEHPDAARAGRDWLLQNAFTREFYTTGMGKA